MVNSDLQRRMPFAYHLTLFILLISGISFGQQSLCFDQVNTFNSEMQGSAFMTVMDSENNTYSLGSFQGTVSFGNGPGEVVLTSNGASDSYLVKNDSEGSFIWVKQFGGTESDVIELLAIDSNDELYLSGSFLGEMDMDPSVASETKTSVGEKDLFLIKIGSSGVYRWSKQLASSTTSEPNDLEILPDGSIIILFKFIGEQDANMGFSEEIINDANGGTAILKMNEEGIFEWVNQLNVFYPRMTFDQDQNLIVCGNFNTTTDFDPGPDIHEMTPVSNQSDLFILKLNDEGEFFWSKQIAGNSIKEIYDITCDKDNNILYTGHFVGTTDFDPGTAEHSINSSFGTDAFLSKLDANGNHIFTKDFGVSSPCNGDNVATDKDGDIYMSGFYLSTMDFNPNGGVFNLENSDFGNHFIVKLKANGGFIYAKQLEGNMPVNGNDLIVTEDKKVIISGGYNGTVDFDTSEEVFEHTTPSGNSYVAIYTQESRVGFTDFLCDSYLSPSGNYEWTQPGTYNDTIMSPDGCPTVYDVELYVINKTILMTQDGSALYAWQSDAEYQWLDCNNNFAPIEGAIDQFYTPEIYGSYAVQITYNSCSVTTNCEEFTYGQIISGINDSQENDFNIFPNPTNGNISIQTQVTTQDIVVTIYDAMGKKLMNRTYSNAGKIDLQLDQAPGIYFVELNGDHSKRKKLVKHF